MQLTIDTDQNKAKDKNTFSTDSSKRQNEIQNQQIFKIERQKYLQQRQTRKQQIKHFRKQNFGSSSSESQPSPQKPKPIQIIKDTKTQTKHPNPIPQNQSQDHDFHAKHQAYIQDKLNRKKQLIELRKKQFPNSSSDSDDQLPQKVEKIIPKSIQKLQTASQQLYVDISKEKSSRKQSFETDSKENPSNRVNARQYAEPKGQKQVETKKITILVQSKKNLQWIEQTMVIQKKRIKLINQNLELMIAQVTKIKLFFSKIQKDFLKMKITMKEDDHFFAVSTKKVDNLDEYYYVFSRVIQQKLMQIGFEPKKNQATIFPNYMNLKDAPSHLKNSIVFGNILKKSQVLGNWQSRFVYITNKQIGSSKKPNDKPSMIIPTETISEMWTRFDIEQNNLLNIKIMYNSGKKTQFGIPISNFTDELNWLYCFYRVINRPQ